MHSLAVWIETVLVPFLGPPGLFIAALLDAFLFLPEINDILVISWSAARPQTAWLSVAMVTLGSLTGCSALWWVGVRGGEPFLERRFGKERVERTRDTFQRWDLLALAVTAVMPPPVPFKVFVFSAGVFGISFRRFVVTVLVARGLRYTAWAAMGVIYGDRALMQLRGVDAWFEAHLPAGVGACAVLMMVGLAVYHRRRRGRATAS